MAMSKKNKKGNKSDRRILIIFILIIAVSLVSGFVLGRLIRRAEQTVTLVTFVGDAKAFLISAVPAIFMIVTILGIILPLASFARCNVMYKKLQKDKENDDLWDTLEDTLNRPMILANAFSMVVLCLFCCFLIIGIQGKEQTTLFKICFLLFIVFACVETQILKLTVEIEKKLNPEKQGNVLDVTFQKVWMNSCDEAQKMMAYKAGYKAYQSTNAVCLILILVAFVCSVTFKTDLLALIFVCVIWFVNNMSYMLRAAKLEKRKSV
jgi:hypothetical protein